MNNLGQTKLNVTFQLKLGHVLSCSSSPVTLNFKTFIQGTLLIFDEAIPVLTNLWDLLYARFD